MEQLPTSVLSSSVMAVYDRLGYGVQLVRRRHDYKDIHCQSRKRGLPNSYCSVLLLGWSHVSVAQGNGIKDRV